MDCLHSISVADITFPHRGQYDYLPMEHRITLHRRLQILCGHAYEQRAFVLFIHFIEFYSIWLVLSWRQTVVINKEKKSHHKWGRKLLNTENERNPNFTNPLYSSRSDTVTVGNKKTVCCPAGQRLIIKQVFLRKSRESNKANWINVHFSWLYRRRKITHWKILSRDMRVRFELFYFLLLSISLNILFFSRGGGKWGDAGWENCLYFLCAFVTFLWDYFATWEIILKCKKIEMRK